MAAGHGVEHVQRLLTPDLADDDSARTLPEGAALEEILERHPARPFHVRVALLETEEILLSQLVQPELGLRLEHTGSLAGRNEQRQDASHRGLPRAGRPDQRGHLTCREPDIHICQNRALWNVTEIDVLEPDVAARSGDTGGRH